MTFGPNGFRVLTTKTSTIQRMYLDGNTAVAVGPGRPVALSSGSSTADKLAMAIPLTAYSANYIGIVLAVYNSKGAEVNYLPASTVGYVDVECDPFAELVVVTGANSTALTQAAIGASADMVGGAVDTVTGIPADYLSETTGTTGKQFIIERLYPSPDNAWGSHYIKLVVRAATHVYIAAVAGI